MSKFVSIIAATAIAGTTLVAAGSADARPGYRGGHYAGGYGYRRGGRGRVGAAIAVGAAASIIGGAIVANQYRRNDGYGYDRRPAYGAYGGPAYGYYGY